MAKRKKARKAKKVGCSNKIIKFKGKETGTGGRSVISFKAKVGPSCPKKAHKKSAQWKANTGKGGRLAQATKYCVRVARTSGGGKEAFFPAKKGTQTPFNKCIHNWFDGKDLLAK